MAAAAGPAVPSIWGDNLPPPSELYFITPIANVPTILQQGILSKKRATLLNPVDISAQEIQDRRDGKVVLNPDRDAAGKKALDIHRCANLYMRAHNAMMYVRKDKGDTLCVLRVDAHILSRQEVVATNMNAAKNEAHFSQARDFSFSPESARLHREPLGYVFEDKNNNRLMEKRKAVRQAEVLVPYKLHPSFIRGAYVANNVALAALQAALPNPAPIPIDIHPSLFFSQHTPAPRGYNPLRNINAQPLDNQDYSDLDYALATSSDSEGSDGESDVEMGTVEMPASDANIDVPTSNNEVFPEGSV